MYGPIIPINIKMCGSFSRILNPSTGPGILWHNNITGTGFFITSPISIMIILQCSKKYLILSTTGAGWEWMASGWMPYPICLNAKDTNGENLPETHVFLKKLRKHIDAHFPGTVLLAEANMWPEDSASYFGNGDECQMNYHFPVMPRMFMALQMEDRYPITDIFDQTPEIPETCQWAIFLRNHDELTLGNGNR